VNEELKGVLAGKSKLLELKGQMLKTNQTILFHSPWLFWVSAMILLCNAIRRGSRTLANEDALLNKRRQIWNQATYLSSMTKKV
jgi:hypothetical protein